MMSAHLAAVIPNFAIMETDIDDVPWKDDLVTQMPAIQDGVMTVATGSGLGHGRQRKSLEGSPPKISAFMQGSRTSYLSAVSDAARKLSHLRNQRVQVVGTPSMKSSGLGLGIFYRPQHDIAEIEQPRAFGNNAETDTGVDKRHDGMNLGQLLDIVRRDVRPASRSPTMLQR